LPPDVTNASAAAPCWELTPFSLAYRIGEITLFRRTWRGLSLREHFFDLSTDPAVPLPPTERLRADVDVIVTRSHPVDARLPPVTRHGDVIRYVMVHYTRHHADLRGDFEGYLAKFSAKTRSTLRRKVRQFLIQEEGSGMREFKRPADMPEFHRLARTVSALTYQERLLDAGLPADKGFAERLEELARADDVRAYVLFMQGKPIAYLCCPALNGVLLYSYLGYDPSYAGLSPGTVLQYLAFESLFAEQRFRAFDFTEGQGEHKQFFGTDATLCADICYFPATASARFWIGLHMAAGIVSTAAGDALEHWGAKSAVKRFLRRHWGRLGSPGSKSTG